MNLKLKTTFLSLLVCFFLAENLCAKPHLPDSLGSDFYRQKGENMYRQQQYKEACEQFMTANEISNNVKIKQIHYTLFFLLLIDVMGLFIFLYLEKRRAYKKLVAKNMQWAQQSDLQSFDEAEKRAIDNLTVLFEEEKIYRNKDLTINDLAIKLNVNKNLISKLTNTYFHKTLPSLLNEYRIKEAVNLLTGLKTRNYKMEAISDMCGFNTRQVFHAVFKKETGLTPNDFRKMALNKDFRGDF
jgi:AraC-like DNA-binding protein